MNIDETDQQQSTDKEKSPARKSYSLSFYHTAHPIHQQFLPALLSNDTQTPNTATTVVQATTISHMSYYSQLLHSHMLLLVLSTVHFHIAASTILLKLSLKPPMASYCIRIKSKSLLQHDFTIATSLTSCSAIPLTPLLLCFSPGSLPVGQTNQTLSYHVPSA